MNLTAYKRYLNIFVLCAISFSKSVQPEQIDSKEILTIYGKDRDYYRLIDNRLTYFVEGPKILNIYSRLAFPKMAKKINPYEFMVFIDESDSFLVRGHYRMDPNTSNEIHPGHSYTVSGHDVINIPKGRHRVELLPITNKSNILIRLTSKKFKKSKDFFDEILPNNNQHLEFEIVSTADNNIKYYALSEKGNDKMSFNAKGPSRIKVFSRLGFSGNQQYGYYQFKVRKDSKLLSNQHVFSSPSKGSSILKNPLIVPSKYRTMTISVPEGNHRYELELIAPEKEEVLFRIIEEK